MRQPSHLYFPLKRPLLVALALLVGGCAPSQAGALPATGTSPPLNPESATPLPVREPHPPGELIDYQAQSGDTLAAVAAHFNTSVEEILEANPEIPAGVTTLPLDFPLSIPAYYLPLTGTPFRILPDSELVNGPSAVGFDTRTEILSRPGFLAGMSDYAFRVQRPAWEVVDVVAQNYSLHPRLLLALLEHGSGALTTPFADPEAETYPLGYQNSRYQGLFRQLLWAAERLNDGYYGWRSGEMREFETAGGKLYRPDPWQNAGTVALQMLFAGLLQGEALESTLGPEGFYRTYEGLWGDPFDLEQVLVPPNLEQPQLALPFEPNRIWDFTGGPHSSWGTSLPMGALDFAPPAVQGGCATSAEWVTAPHAGVIARSGEAIVVLDLDGDGDERTGWTLFFFHIAERDRIAQGTQVNAGDLLGHPSCEGGRSTGTHFHLARRYNGEWLPADGAVPFVLDGWVAAAGDEPYEGTLTKGSMVVTACTCTTGDNRILYELPSSR